MNLESLAPKKFFCYYTLTAGTLFIAIVMSMQGWIDVLEGVFKTAQRISLKFCTNIEHSLVEPIAYYCLAMLTGTSIIIQVITVQGLDCDMFVLRTAYGFGISAMMYNLLMIVVNIWLIWAVKKRKATVVIVWVVVSSVWLVKLFVLVVVLMIVHDLEVGKTGGTLCLLIEFIGFAVLVYFIFVVFGYWVEMKKEKKVLTLPPVKDIVKETKDVAKDIVKA